MAEEKQLTLKALFERDIRFAIWSGEVEDVGADGASDGSWSQKIRIYTATNCYSIKGHRRSDGHTYLGCIASTRKPRAGEEHTRGNDLPDGPFDEETWRRILAAIVGYELVKIHRTEQKRPTIDELETILATEDGAEQVDFTAGGQVRVRGESDSNRLEKEPA